MLFILAAHDFVNDVEEENELDYQQNICTVFLLSAAVLTVLLLLLYHTMHQYSLQTTCCTFRLCVVVLMLTFVVCYRSTIQQSWPVPIKPSQC